VGTVAIAADLRRAGIDPADKAAVLRYIALIPVPRTNRIQLLRQYETETLTAFDPRDFARAVDGIPPA
jgi:hypothetical protein